MTALRLRFVVCAVLVCGVSGVLAACGDDEGDDEGGGVVDVTPDGGGSETGARDTGTAADTSVTDAGLEASDASDASG